MRFLPRLLLFLLLGSSLLAVPSEKALRYHQLLVKKPQPGTVLDRFVDTWLETDSPKALADFLKDQAQRPEASPNDHLLFALYLAYQGTDDTAALAAFEDATAATPDNATAWQEKAKLEARMLDFPRALASLDKALAQHPEPKQALDLAKQRGRTLLRLGQTKQALEAWASLLKDRGSDEDLADELVDLQVEEGLYAEAAAQLTELITHTKDPYNQATRRLRLGDIQLRLAKKPEALAVYAEALGQAATDSWIESEALARIETTFRREDDIKGLATHLDTLAKANPQRLSILKSRAQVLAESGDKEAALALYHDILQRSPGQRELRESYLDLLEKFERYADAIAQTKVLMEQHKTDKELHLRLATLQHKANDKAASAASLDAFLAMPGVNEFDHLRVANMLDNWKRLDEAKQRFAAVIAAYPKSFEVRDAHAQFLHRNADKEAALAVWRDLAKGVGRDELLIVGSSLIARQESKTAFDLLSARVAEFGHEPQYLAPLCQAALATKQAKAAVPWVLSRVRLSDESNGLPDALKQAEAVLRDADAMDSTLIELRAIKEPGVSDRCLLSALLESQGDLAGAEAALQSPTSNAASVSSLQSQLIRLFQGRQEFAKAADVLTKLLITPDGKTAQNAQRRVDMLNRAGDTEAAIKAIELWKQLAPSAAQPFLSESQLLRNIGKTEEALAILRAAARKFEDDDGVASALADTYAELGQYVQTERIYLKLYEQASDQTAKLRSVKSLADAALLRAETARLIGVFQERQRTNRADATPWLALATIYEVASRDTDQVAALVEAAKLRPADVQLAHQIARLQENQGQWQQAKQTLDRVAASDTTDRTRTMLALMELRNGQPEKAYAALAQLAGGDTMDARDAELIADTMASSGDWERMITFLQPLVVKHPADYRLGYQFAVALEEMGKSEAAISEFSRLVQISTELPGFPKAKSTKRPWWDEAYEDYPPGASACLRLANDSYSAYQYRRQRSQSQTTKGGFLTLADGVDAAQVRAACHLFKLAQDLSEAEQEKLGVSLKGSGVRAWPVVAYGTQLQEWGGIEVPNEALDRFPDDLVLNILWTGGQDGSEENMKRFRGSFDLLKEDYPGIALDKVFAALAVNAEAARPLLDEAATLISRVKKANNMSVWRIARIVGGSQNIERDEGDTVDIPEDIAKQAMAVFRELFQRQSIENEFRCAASIFLTHAFVKRQAWSELVTFFNTEAPLYSNNPAALKASRSMFSPYQSGNRGQPVLQFPAPGHLPPHLAMLLAYPDPYNPESYGLMKQLPDGKGLLAELDKVNDPHLRVFFAWWAGDAKRAEEEASKVLAKADISAEDYLLAAGLASRMEQPERALDLLVKGSLLPMQSDDRKIVDAGFISLLRELKKVPDTVLEPARLAVRRVRTASTQNADFLPELMEKLGMKDEAERFARQLAAKPSTTTQRYSSGYSQRDAGKRIDDLTAKGNLDGAARELMVQMTNYLNNYNNGNLSYAVQSGPSMAKQHKEAAKRAMETLEKQATSGNKRAEYAQWLDIFGEKDKARDQFTKVAELQPKNAQARARLIALTLEKDLNAGAKMLEELPLDQFSNVINGGLAMSMFQLDYTIEQRSALLTASMRILDKLSAAKQPLPAQAEQGFLVLPSLARYSANRSKELRGYLNDRLQPREVKATDKPVQMRRETHDTLCKAMLKFPALAPTAFASLTCTQDEAFLLKTAREILQTPMGASRKQPSLDSRYVGDSDGYERRWLPFPVEYLIGHAATHGALESISKELLPLAEKAIRPDELRIARALAALWQCPEAEFPNSMKAWFRVSNDSSNYYWQSSPRACVPIEVWQQRKLTIPLDETLGDFAKSINGWGTPASLVRYVEILAAGAGDRALTCMETVATRMIGSGESRARRAKAYMVARYGSGGTSDQQMGILTQTLESMVRYAPTTGIAFAASDKIGFSASSEWVENLNGYMDSDSLRSSPELFVSMLRNQSFLADAKAFDPHESGRRSSTLGNLFGQVEGDRAFLEDVRTLLAKEPAQTFGVKLCIAFAAESKDRPAAVTDFIKKQAADFALIGESRRSGLGSMLRWAVPSMKTPSSLDPAVAKALEPIIGSVLKEQSKQADKMLAAKAYKDLGFRNPDGDYELRREFPAMLAELARTDRNKAKRLFQHVLPLAETKQAKEGMSGYTYTAGWTMRSAVINQIVTDYKSMEAVGFAYRMMAEDTSGLLIAGMDANMNNVSTAMHELFRNNGGQGNVGRGLTELLKRLEVEMEGASPAPLITPFYEFTGKLAQSLRIPALKWCAQSKHPHAADLEAAIRLHITTNNDTRKNAGMLKAMDEVGGVAKMWQHYQSIVLNEKLPPQVRLSIASRLLRLRWHDADADLVRTATSLAAAETKAFHACGGDQELRYILRSFVRLPVDEVWQTQAKELWDGWLVRNARNGESERYGRAYHPNDESVDGILQVASRAGQTEWCEKLLRDTENSQSNEPSAIIALVQGGQHELAARYLERWSLKIIHNPNAGMFWNAQLAEQMPKFVAALSKPEWGMFAEILINNRLTDAPEPDPGTKSRKDRMLALVPKFKSTSFTDPDLRQRCLEFFAQINEVADLLAEDYAASIKMLDLEKAMKMGTWESFLYTGPTSSALANQLWKGNAQPALELLPKVIAAVPGNTKDNDSPLWTAGYIFGAPIFDSNWRWEQGHTFDTTALVKLYEALAVQMPQPASMSGVQTVHIAARAVELLMVIRAVEGDLTPFDAWRKSLTEEQRKTIQRSFKDRNNLIAQCGSYFGKGKTKFTVEQRAKAIALILKDPWVAPLFPDSGTNIPNISGPLLNQGKCFTPAEYGAVAVQFAEALPRKGKTAGEAADVLFQQGKVAESLPLFDLALKQCGPDVNTQASYLFRKVEALERMNKKDEAKAALNSLPKEKLGANNQKQRETMLKRLGA